MVISVGFVVVGERVDIDEGGSRLRLSGLGLYDGSVVDIELVANERVVDIEKGGSCLSSDLRIGGLGLCDDSVIAVELMVEKFLFLKVWLETDESTTKQHHVRRKPPEK